MAIDMYVHTYSTYVYIVLALQTSISAYNYLLMYILVCECTYVMSEVNFLCMHLHHHSSSLILVCI